MKRITVAVDGPAGSGKSTVAREVARRLGYMYVDTGAMYRAAALKARRRDLNPDDEPGLIKLLKDTSIDLVADGDRLIILLDGEDVSQAIRTEEAGMDASAFSRSPAVRERLVDLQRHIGRSGGVVMEGRDIGTVVFPQAEYKIFLDATPETRASRRTKEFEAKGIHVEKSEILERVRRRDQQDSTRPLAPLKAAPDAIKIDTSEMTLEQVVNNVVEGISQLISMNDE